MSRTIDGDSGDDVRASKEIAAAEEEVRLLDLRGLSSCRLADLQSDPTGRGFSGTVVYLGADGEPTGECFAFTQIEHILTDPDDDGGIDESWVGHDPDPVDRPKAGGGIFVFKSVARKEESTTPHDSTMSTSKIRTITPCFTPGTAIATPRGERLVEDLREGDRIITRDNGIQEIRWVGRSKLSGKSLVGVPHMRPIRIAAGALGHGLPERDLLVSPNHRILLSNDRTQLYFEDREVLAAAKHMVGLPGIQPVNAMSVTYLHFMFDRHEIVLSNGAWTESFQPGDLTLKGIGDGQRSELLELFPELQTRAGVADYKAARRSLTMRETLLLVR